MQERSVTTGYGSGFYRGVNFTETNHFGVHVVGVLFQVSLLLLQ